MNLAPFQDIPFDDQEAMDDFRMALQANHDRIAQKMYANSKFYKTYPLIDTVEHSKDWQQNLQQELGSIYTLLNLNGLPDFASTDLSREDDFQDWVQQLIFVETTINANLQIY